jgi:predicted RNA-binding protein with PIN domain
MDMQITNKEALMKEIKEKLDPGCIDFTNVSDMFYEQIALTKDDYLDYYLAHNTIDTDKIVNGIKQRLIFPCYFGSALKMNGMEEFLTGLDMYTKRPNYSDEFGAKVYKITRDEHGDKLTHMKITGGHLKVKTQLLENEKIDQIRKYSGNKYELVNEVNAGDVCAIKGLHSIYAGMSLGSEHQKYTPILSSYMRYRIVLPSNSDSYTMLKNLHLLSEEDPQLQVTYQEQTKDIYLQLMGEIQIEILKRMIKDRFDVDVSFDQGKIVYKETISEANEGIGHYEPLKHYAEVHLLLEPGKLGSGLQFFNRCKEDVLSRNYQRLILSHLEEKEHLGVLTGTPITDMKITLLTGKAHNKHTEGGDFRQATYRAVRQGLKSTSNILLEPIYQFILEIPSEYLSKAIYDIEQMHGQMIIPENIKETIVIKGSAPVVTMQNYQSQVIAYTKGKGRLYCTLKGYEPCHNTEEVIANIQYNSENDIDNPTGSVFCSHGAGFTVPWNEVREYMQIDSGWKKKTKIKEQPELRIPIKISEAELESIFTRTYGPTKQRTHTSANINIQISKQEKTTYQNECLLVDGYNVIHAWSSLKKLVPDHLDIARQQLLDIMCNYQGYKQNVVIIVFDAYKVKDNPGTVEKYDNIYVVYTKEAQTADAYIERTTHALGKEYNILVATSDAMEQLIVVGLGARRISSQELEIEVEYINKEYFKEYERKNRQGYNYLLEDIKDYKE